MIQNILKFKNVNQICAFILPFTLSFFILIFTFSFSVCLSFRNIAHASVVATSLTQSTTLNNGLVGWWTFDGKDIVNGVVKDKSGNGNDGNPMNIASSTFYAPGKIGQAGNFDGVNDYVKMPIGSGNSLDIAGDVTISVWIKPTTYVSATIIRAGILNDDRYELNVMSTKKLRFGWYDGAFKSITTTSNATNYPLNTWSHIVFIRSGTTGTFYYNGTFLYSAAVTAPTVAAVNARIGDTNTDYFPGSIDDVRIYNRALSATEVAQLYNLGSGTKYDVTPKYDLNSGLVGWWTFDGADMVKGVAQDKSGNGNNGNLINISTSTFYAPGKLGQAGNFDGVNDYVKSGGTSGNSVFDFGSNPYTFSVWYKTSTTTQVTFLEKYNAGAPYTGYGFGLNMNISYANASGYVYIDGLDGNYLNKLVYANIGATVYNGKWHHVVGIRNGTVGTIYFDGVQQTTTGAIGSGSISNISNLYIGSGTLNKYFPGSLDDVRIYNRALTATEIAQLYNLGAGTKFATSPKYDLTSGLVGWWTFDGTDMIKGVAQDKSGNGNNGNLINISTSTFYTQGKLGQAGNFDGVNDYVSVPLSSSFSGLNGKAYTLSLWVRDTSSVSSLNSRFDRLISWDTNAGATNIQLGVADHSSDYQVYYIQETNGSSVKTATGKAPAGWNHVVATSDGSNFKMYVNGVENDGGTTSSVSTVYTGNTSNLFIGQRGNGAYAKASIDDVRIYNRTLSATEVQQLYQMGR